MNEHETSADIIAEIRALSNPISDGIIAINGRRIADRLEAAHKRELSKNASKNGADFGQLGDAAKLRDALKSCVDEMCNRCRDLSVARGNPLPCLSGCEPVRKAKAALAAPLRNCDRFKTAAEAAHRRERGDCAKLREALEKIRAIAKTFMDATQMRRVTDSARIDVGNIKDLADAALAEPVKNCEVGTAEEQFERWETFCDSYDKNCTGCLCDDGHTCTLAYCFAKWAQMPYDEEGGSK